VLAKEEVQGAIGEEDDGFYLVSYPGPFRLGNGQVQEPAALWRRGLRDGLRVQLLASAQLDLGEGASAFFDTELPHLLQQRLLLQE
jgi:hypothetical protein